MTIYTSQEEIEPARRFKAIVSIFRIDEFYKPKVNIEDVYKLILELRPEGEEYREAIEFISKYFLSKNINKITISAGIFKNFGGNVEQLMKYHESFSKAY